MQGTEMGLPTTVVITEPTMLVSATCTVPSDTTKRKNKQPTCDTERHTVTRVVYGHSEKIQAQSLHI